MTTRINRDTVIAILLLLGCGILFWSTFSIRVPEYGQMAPSTWPRAILVGLSILGLIYLIQSLRQGANGEQSNKNDEVRQPGLAGWILYWRNPLWCYLLFFLYLVTLPVAGSLIGGVLFVFILMGVLGGWSFRNMVLHAALALVMVGGMWGIFTFGLGVLLPPGEIFSPF